MRRVFKIYTVFIKSQISIHPNTKYTQGKRAKVINITIESIHSFCISFASPFIKKKSRNGYRSLFSRFTRLNWAQDPISFSPRPTHSSSCTYTFGGHGRRLLRHFPIIFAYNKFHDIIPILRKKMRFRFAASNAVSAEA